jgi:hypothetical protein
MLLCFWFLTSMHLFFSIGREKWIADILQPTLQAHGLLQRVDLYLPDRSYLDDDVYAQLAGYQIDLPQRNKQSGPPPAWDKAPVCFNCRQQFSFTLRQHHCR